MCVSANDDIWVTCKLVDNFEQLYDLKIHLASQYKYFKNLQCDLLCDKVCGTSYELQNHIIYFHNIVKKNSI